MECSFKVASKKCEHCLFTKDKLVSDERRKDILEGCLRDDTYFQCHMGTLNNIPLMCRGFYDSTYGDRVTPCQLAKRIPHIIPNIVEYINPDDLPEVVP